MMRLFLLLTIGLTLGCFDRAIALKLAGKDFL